ncbi:IDEAL domain-containing protein [Paenibacillus sepulcri]|uniref:IDEAL domain-containing protein n=1 Tax=Paenibacillus sepulcri TaxID=359917 RepID=A0ABS7BYX7_9BACL|nr:IDEAL domain-containing protein [Paenibacillus sepulcri]
MTFEISDWVQANTSNGELIHGYIESMDGQQGIVKLMVVKSDNEEAVGKSITVREHGLKRLPVASFDDVGQILNLIDLALSTHDEAWFTELTAKLKPAEQNAQESRNFPRIHTSFTNRLGLYDIK